MFRKAVKKLVPRKLFRAIEPYGHLAEAILWNLKLGFPARGMKVIGVTGTDGKTTTSTMIYTMLNDAGIKTGLMATIGYGTPNNWHDNHVHMTSMPTLPMLRRIKEMKQQGIDWLVLETTSHALAQYRIWGVPYSLAVMTNVTHEHLDYHRTLKRYRAAKMRLFTLVSRNHNGLRTGIVNADDPNAGEFAHKVPFAIRYGIKHGNLRASEIKLGPNGSTYTVSFKQRIPLQAIPDGIKPATTRDRRPRINVKLPGQFNVYNSLAAVGVGITLGLTDEQIAHGIAALESVSGRMNRIEEGQKFTIVVDFAHTPDSFEKILSQMRELTTGKLIVVFGSAGRRDETKRAKQGAAAGKWADLVVVTEEDNRDVDGLAIMDMIARGAEAQGKVRGQNLMLIGDRTEAINYAIDQAGDHDAVLLLGKGHEKTIERADGEHPWDESAVARAAIHAKLGK